MACPGLTYRDYFFLTQYVPDIEAEPKSADWRNANGNIGQYLDSSGTIAAKYEYSPEPSFTVKSGAMADELATGASFSTKPWDEDLDAFRYELRILKDSRWMSRDPIGERGGWNLYVFANNCPASGWDYLGLTETYFTRTKRREVVMTERWREYSPECVCEYRYCGGEQCCVQAHWDIVAVKYKNYKNKYLEFKEEEWVLQTSVIDDINEDILDLIGIFLPGTGLTPYIPVDEATFVRLLKHYYKTISLSHPSGNYPEDSKCDCNNCGKEKKYYFKINSIREKGKWVRESGSR